MLPDLRTSSVLGFVAAVAAMLSNATTTTSTA
jgi:hypothetical protein